MRPGRALCYFQIFFEQIYKMTTEAERTSAAMKDISKKSLQVKNSAANPIAKPSNDLMGSLTDEFHTVREKSESDERHAISRMLDS